MANYNTGSKINHLIKISASGSEIKQLKAHCNEQQQTCLPSRLL